REVKSALARNGLNGSRRRRRGPSRRRDRRVVLDQPRFPGYLFLRFLPSREAYGRIAGTDGVVRVLGERWDALHPVPDEQVDAVRRIVGAGDARPLPWIRVGDRVRIAGGVLAGVEGLVQTWHAGRATFVVSVDLLQRSVGVELDSGMLERL